MGGRRLGIERRSAIHCKFVVVFCQITAAMATFLASLWEGACKAAALNLFLPFLLKKICANRC
jgi:hypothetical protein